jgi:hypothetical protein
MWSSLMGKRMWLMPCILPKLRDGSKRVTNFQNDWKKFLKWYDGGGENGLTQKIEFEVKTFFSSKYFHLYPHVRLFGGFFLLSLFFQCFFFSIFSILHLFIWGWTLIFEDIFEERTNFNFVFKSTENRYIINGYGRVEEILMVDAYPRMDLHANTFWVWLATNFFMKE